MEGRRQWFGWIAGVAMALAFAAHAESPAPGGDDSGVGSAARAIRGHAGERRLVLLGESHGTREIPDLVETLATGYAQDGPVLVGLEVAYGEQASLDAYMASDGGAQARAALRERAYWTRHDDQHDGRRSEDMLDLIESMRRLRAGGRDVALLAFDMNPDTPRRDGDARNRFMAQVVRSGVRALPRGRVLILAGHVHAMLVRPSYAPPQMPTPTGVFLRDLDPASIRIGAKTGQSWACITPRPCGPVPADRSPRRTGPHPLPHTFGVMLERFTVARLMGASSATH